jgi:hypothetical protein
MSALYCRGGFERLIMLIQKDQERPKRLASQDETAIRTAMSLAGHKETACAGRKTKATHCPLEQLIDKAVKS